MTINCPMCGRNRKDNLYTVLLSRVAKVCVDELKDKLSALLQTADALDPKKIPEVRKMIAVQELAGSPVRIKSMLSNLGVGTIWELVHLPYGEIIKWRCFTNSRARMAELVAAIDEAIKMLKGDVEK